MNIALIDDEEDYVLLFKHLLEESLDDSKTVEYFSSFEEIQETEAFDYDLVLCDHLIGTEYTSVDVRKYLESRGWGGVFLVVSIADEARVVRDHIEGGLGKVATLQKGRSTVLRDFIRSLG